MNFNYSVNFKKSVKIIKGNGKSLVCNIDNAESIFLSNECVDIINAAIKEKMTFNELLDAIEEDKSKEYMNKLVNKLESLHMWSYENNELIQSNQFSISIDITDKCNLRCKHCCISAGEKIKGEDLSHEDLLNVVYKVAKLNPQILTLSGGEPLMREDFKEITESIRAIYDGTLTLMTNAVLIDEDMAAFIAENYDAVDVSIDGVDEQSCALLRGEGVFEKTIHGINLLKQAGVKQISASMVKTKENHYAVSDFNKLCEELKVTPMIRALDNSGRARSIYDNINIIDSREYDEKRAEDSFVKNKIYRLRPQIFACQGAKRQFQIDYTGNIFPCAALMDDKFCLGNVINIDNLKEYFEQRKFEDTEGYKEFNSLLPYNLNGCEECNENILYFSCANEIRRYAEQGILEEVCKENRHYYKLYWGSYESV